MVCERIQTEKMPKLGFGLMRLPQNGGAVDVDGVKRMVDAYMESGFNYFDTAYVYHGGNSERVIKEALVDRYPRESFYLATKLPAWVMNGPEDRDRIFGEQLEKCGVEYFDFYLLHSLEDGKNYDCMKSTTASAGPWRRKNRVRFAISDSPTTEHRSCWSRCWTVTRRWNLYRSS